MLENKEGHKIPDVVFHTRSEGDWKDVTSDELFKGKKVIVFSLPGAFTPTCSSSHLPRFEELTPQFQELGIDAVICIAVNDAFVMEAWGRTQNVSHIMLIPDGNGEFTERLGMLVDKTDLGFGKRSWRYSMLVNDGTIEKMFIEPDKPGDPFEVSDADTMLRSIKPDVELPDEVTIISKPGCSFCLKAKKLLRDHGLQFEDIELGHGVSYKSLRNLTGHSTAPQVIINGRILNGLEELEDYLGHSGHGSTAKASASALS